MSETSAPWYCTTTAIKSLILYSHSVLDYCIYNVFAFAAKLRCNKDCVPSYRAIRAKSSSYDNFANIDHFNNSFVHCWIQKLTTKESTLSLRVWNLLPRIWVFNFMFCIQKNIREKHYPYSQLSHILTNISKQHIFNYLSEINIFNKLLFSLWHDMVCLCWKWL